MKISKLVEILTSLCEKEPESDVVFDTYRSVDEIIPSSVYDLIGVGVEHKNCKTVIKLSFEERLNKENKHPCRMKNMNIKLLKSNLENSEGENNE